MIDGGNGDEPSAISKGRNRRGTPPARETVLERCRHHAETTAEKILQHFFHDVDDDLFERADKCTSNQECNLFLEGARLVRLEKEPILNRFRRHYAEQVEACLSGCADKLRQPAEKTPDAELTLVNEAQLEEALAVDNLVAKIHNRFADELFALEKRFAALLHPVPIRIDTIPFGPETLCLSLGAACRPLDMDIRVKLYMFKILDRILMEALRDVYQTLNRYLVEAGILPKLKIVVKNCTTPRYRPDEMPGCIPHGMPSGMPNKTESAGSVAAAYTSAPARTEMGSTAGASRGETSPAAAAVITTEPVSIQAQMFQALQCLLAGTGEGGEAEPSGTSGSAPNPKPNPALNSILLETLTDLQQDLSRGSGQRRVVLPLQVKTQVRQRLRGHDGGKGLDLQPLDGEIIDVIAMIFDYILDDPSLPDFVKALIARLQIPVLKVAIIDRQFFQRRSHPVRQLLNELAYAGVGWLDENEAAKDRLYERMEDVVTRLLCEFESDITIFESLLEEFRQFVEEEKQRFLAAREAVRRRAARREAARRQASADLARSLQRRRVPMEVRDFLLHSWRRVLVETALRAGEDSPERRQALQVMDDLLWSLNPEPTAEARRKLTLLLPLMLDALRNGLRSIGKEAQEIEQVMDMLSEHHLQALKPESRTETASARDVQPGERPASQATSTRTTADTERGGDIDCLIKRMNADIEALPDLGEEDLNLLGEWPQVDASQGESAFEKMLEEMGLQGHEDGQEDPGPRIDDEYTALIQELPLGSWVELTLDGERKRLKLAWKGDTSTPFSFMNRQYKVVAEMPFYVLAEEFRRGRAAVIEDVALFDRALDGVISGIMKLGRKEN